MKIEDFVTVKNVMPVDFCEDFIENAKNGDWDKHKWTDNYEHKQEFSRDGAEELDIQFTDKEMHKKLNPFIDGAIHSYMNGLGDHGEMIADIVSKYSNPRLNRYSLGQGMAKHYDHIHSLFSDHEGVPVLSIVGLLNDNFKGGDFVIRGKKIKLKQGDILIMPSAFLYAHEVLPVKEGVRNSFVCWAY